jgi:hypothetical protein
VNGYAKGGDIRVGSYAQGGSVLGRSRDFLKECVEFRDPDEGKRKDAYNVGELADGDQKYAKSGAGAGKGDYGGAAAKRTGDKSLKAVKPKK